MDIREAAQVMLCETISSGLCRRRLQVEQLRCVLLLIIGQPFSHMIQHPLHELLTLLVGQILPEPLRVQAHLVSAADPDRREMILESPQIGLRVRIQPRIQEVGYNLSLGVKGAGADVHQPVKLFPELLLVRAQICQLRKVDGHDTDRAGRLAGAEESAVSALKLTQVKTKSAAHGTDIRRLHVAVHIIGEIRRTILRGHPEEELIVLTLPPVKILRDGIGRNRILEAASLCVSLRHDLDERLIDHVHLFFAVPVGEVHLFPADNCLLVLQILRNRPVQRNIRERRLAAPSGRGIHAVDEALHALLHTLVIQSVYPHERRKVRVKGGKCLRAGPFVLHDAQEVYHLIAQCGQMLRGARRDPAGYALDSLADQLLQVPARAVRSQHRQIVKMDRSLLVQLRDLCVIDLIQPVIRGNRSGVGKNQSAQRILYRRILLHPPVKAVQISMHQLGIIQHARSRLTDALALAAVQDISLGHTEKPGLGKHLLHGILNRLDVDDIVLGAHQSVNIHEHLVHDILCRHRRSGCLERLLHCGLNLIPVERHDRPVSLSDL